jgi:SAM-dependent methyltransferase
MLSPEVNMAGNLIYNQKVLREEAYADDARLDVRYRTHQLYTLDPVDFGRWTLERLPWRGDEQVLDMGCGPGELLCGMARQHTGWGALVGFDPSSGMVAQAMAAAAAGDLLARFCVADAQNVPLPDVSFDVVMARHMLYHVPDIDRAVAEAARLLRPGGYLLTVTNSANTMPEYSDLIKQAADRFPAVSWPGGATSRFALENAPAFLERYFDPVETFILPGTLRFPLAQPFVDYVDSGRALLMRPGHSDAEWQAVLDFVRAEAEAVIRRQGHFDVTKVAGAVVGRKGG